MDLSLLDDLRLVGFDFVDIRFALNLCFNVLFCSVLC